MKNCTHPKQDTYDKPHSKGRDYCDVCLEESIRKSGYPARKLPMPFAEFVALMVLLMGLASLSIDAVLPMLDALREDLSIPNANDAQYTISAMFLGLTLGQFIYGPLSDSFGRKTMIYLGMVIFCAGSFLSIIATGFPLFLAGRTLQGLGAASARVITVAMVRDCCSGREMARIMSIIFGTFIMVPIIAPSIGQAVIMLGHWRDLFIMFLVIAVIAVTWMHFRLGETLSEGKRRPFNPKELWQNIKEVLSNKITSGYMICSGLIFGGLIGYLTSAQQIFQDYYDTGKMFPIYFASLAMAAGLASLVNSRIVRRYGMQIIARYGFIGMALSSAVIVSVDFFQPALPLPVFMVYGLITFFCMGLLFGNLNAVAMEPMGHIAGIASAVIGSFSSAISLIIGSIIGMLFNMTLIPLCLGFFLTAVAGLLTQTWVDRFSKG